jgi:NAD(P)-dependent dehydrogenase (short-subunit alcohol dehydrogenase family)
MSNSTPVTLVLGASGGIGSEVSRRLAARGDRLVLASRDSSRLGDLGETLGAKAFALDARNTEEVQAAVDLAVSEYGRIDGIANCVGSLLLKPAHLTSDEEWDETIATNLRSAFGTVRAAGKAMAKTGGSVVLVSSAAARLGLANHEAIAAAKAGVTGLALSAAATYASRGIRFNVVAPGMVETPLTEKLVSNDAMRKGSEALHAAGRIGTPSDVASMIAWLLDPEHSWVTGQVFGVDGGLATVRSRKA